MFFPEDNFTPFPEVDGREVKSYDPSVGLSAFAKAPTLMLLPFSKTLWGYFWLTRLLCLLRLLRLDLRLPANAWR